VAVVRQRFSSGVRPRRRYRLEISQSSLRRRTALPQNREFWDRAVRANDAERRG
jgi:hypothetical protein